MTVKESDKEKKLGCKRVWHILAEGTDNFKQNTFFVSKSECQQTCVNSCYMRKHMDIQLFLTIHKKMITLAHLIDLKHETIFENTACKTPQQNSYAESAFTMIVAKTRAVMNAAQIPKNKYFKLLGEMVKTVTALDNLIPVTWNGVSKTQYEHAGHEIPKFVKYLRTFREARIVKNMKDGKVGNTGKTMMFMGYTTEHARNCYRMYNPITSQVCEKHDIIWCGRMYFTSENCDKTKSPPVIAVPISNDVSNEDLIVTEVIKVTSY